MLKTIATATLVAATATATAQQSVVWSLDVATVLENREGDDYYTPDQTIFQTRVSPEIGISLLGGEHLLMGGVAWTQPCDSHCDDYDVAATVYYQYRSPAWSLTLGMFPRSKLIEPMHTVEWSDLMAYSVPNIRGALLQVVRPRGFAEFSLDWRALQSATRREAFNVNLNTRWNPAGALTVGGRAHYNHLAKSSANNEDQGVNDDVMLNPYIGLNLAAATPLDSLTITAGPIAQLERDRADGKGWRTPAGVLIDAAAEWKWLGVKETFFAGKNLYPLYSKYGDLLNLGHPGYQSKIYSRTGVYAYIFRNRFVNLEAALDFHYTTEAFYFWQKISLRVYVDSHSWTRKDAACTREERLRSIY